MTAMMRVILKVMKSLERRRQEMLNRSLVTVTAMKRVIMKVMKSLERRQDMLRPQNGLHLTIENCQTRNVVMTG